MSNTRMDRDSVVETIYEALNGKDRDGRFDWGS